MAFEPGSLPGNGPEALYSVRPIEANGCQLTVGAGSSTQHHMSKPSQHAFLKPTTGAMSLPAACQPHA